MTIAYVFGGNLNAIKFEFFNFILNIASSFTFVWDHMTMFI